MQACPANTLYTGSFFQYLAASPIILLQSSLFIHTIYHEYHRRRTANATTTTTKLTPRVLYICLQILGLYWTINDFFRLIIAPLFPPSSTGCKITSGSSRITAMLYYCLYAYIILSRLYHTFDASPLQMKKCTFQCLKILIIVTYSTSILVYLASNVWSIQICLRRWTPFDIDRDLSFCSVANSNDVIGGLILVASTFLFNIGFAVVFCVRLNRLLSDQCDDKLSQFEFKTLIVKISTLSLCGAVSTITCWTLWIMAPCGVEDIFLYIDALVNVLMIGLMFKYNDKQSRRLCKCCIVLCLAKCARKNHERDLAVYLENESRPKLDLEIRIAAPRLKWL